MKVPSFGITKEGQLYRWNRQDHWIRLGHIAYVLDGQTAIAREACEWWQARLASNEPTENLAIRKGAGSARVLVSDTYFKAGWQPCPEPVEALLAAD
jgi:hypothetical protein